MATNTSTPDNRGDQANSTREVINKGDKYTCAKCDGVFLADWSHEEAIEELEENFEGHDVAECAVVCDDCYNEYLVFEQTWAESPFGKFYQYLLEWVEEYENDSNNTS